MSLWRVNLAHRVVYRRGPDCLKKGRLLLWSEGDLMQEGSYSSVISSAYCWYVLFFHLSHYAEYPK